MHIHASQPNPYAAVDALRSAQKAVAKREAEGVRNELIESASELAGESEFGDVYVTRLEERAEQESRPKQRNRRNEAMKRKPAEEELDSGFGDTHLSDWA